MKKLILVLLGLMALESYSQGFVKATEKYTNLNDIKSELTPYFEEQRAILGDEAFFHEGSEYNAYLQFLRHWEPLVSPHGEFSEVFQAERTYWDGQNDNSSGRRSPGNSDDWHELGPYSNNDNNQLGPFTGSKPMGIGPVEFITINENNPNEILTGSLFGGLFYSSDAAATWSNHGSDGWEYSGCAHAVFHPNLNNVVYACSNRESINSQPSTLGTQGKIKRLVGGNWETIGDHADFQDTYNVYYKLLIDPLNNPATNGTPLRLYVATRYGLYYTDDADDPVSLVNWTKDSHSLLNGKIYDIEFVPNQTGNSADRIVASVYTESDHTWRVVYTANRGATWQVLPNHPSLALGTFFNGTETEVVDADKFDYVTIEMSNADDDAVFIYAGRPSSTSRDVYKFSWNTGVWTQIHSAGGSNFGNNRSFGVAQTDADYIAISSSVNMRITTNGYATSTSEFTGHDDVEDIVWDPNSSQIIYVANHGGVYKSTNAGQDFEMASQGLGVAEVLGLATAATDPGRIAIGLNHDGTQVTLDSYSEPFAPEWHWRGQYADAFNPMIDYNDADNVWTKAQWAGSSSFKFLDEVLTDIGTAAGTDLYDGTYYSPYWTKVSALNTEDPSIVYFNFVNNVSGSPYFGKMDLLRSTNYGSSNKQQITRFHSTYPSMTDYTFLGIYTDPSNEDVVYLLVKDETTPGVFKSRLFRQTDVNNPSSGTVQLTWQELEIPRDNVWPSDIQVSHQDGNILYFGYQSMASPGTGMFYRVDYTSTNNCTLGSNCFDHTSNLPNRHGGANSIIAEQGTNDGIYFITNGGAYFSNQTNLVGGVRQWEPIGTNLPHSFTYGADINYGINKIRIGFKGRGVWEHDLHCPDLTNATETGVHTVDKFIEVMDNITSTAIVPSSKDVDYRAGFEVDLLPGFEALPGSDFFAFIHPCDESGNSFKSATDPGAISQVNEMEHLDIIDEPSEKLAFNVFPNPSGDGRFNVTIPKLAPGASLEVINLMGQKVYATNVTSNQIRINLSGEDRGVYLVRIVSGEDIYQRKIVYQ